MNEYEYSKLAIYEAEYNGIISESQRDAMLNLVNESIRDYNPKETLAKFKNRKVKEVNAKFVKNAKEYKSLRDLLSEMKDDPYASNGSKTNSGLINGLYVSIDDRTSDHVITKDHMNAIVKAYSSIGKLHSQLCKQIVDTYNNSKGKEGPWDWTNDEDEYSKKSVSAASSRITLETFRVSVSNRGINVEFWFDDGGLWGGHVIIVDTVNDPKTGAYTNPNKIKYSIEG